MGHLSNLLGSSKSKFSSCQFALLMTFSRMSKFGVLIAIFMVCVFNEKRTTFTWFHAVVHGSSSKSFCSFRKVLSLISILFLWEKPNFNSELEGVLTVNPYMPPEELINSFYSILTNFKSCTLSKRRQFSVENHQYCPLLGTTKSLNLKIFLILRVTLGIFMDSLNLGSIENMYLFT